MSKFYRDNLNTPELSGMPVLEQAFIYNDCEVLHCGWSEKINGEFIIKDGWSTRSGRFVRFDETGNPIRKGDRTIAALLAAIHWNLGANFNRFFSYVDETRLDHEMPYEHTGFDPWLESEEDIRAINTDVPILIAPPTGFRLKSGCRSSRAPLGRRRVHHE